MLCEDGFAVARRGVGPRFVLGGLLSLVGIRAGAAICQGSTVWSEPCSPPRLWLLMWSK